MKLYTSTPLGAAIMEALEVLNEEITEAIQGAEPGSCKAYVFGGAAIHIYTNARGSSDIDVELEAVEKIQLEEIIVDYVDEEGNEQSVEIDTNFSTGISGMLMEGYRDDAIPLKASKDEPLHVFLVSALVLAVHKLDRLATDDQNDIISLAKAGRITSQELYDAGMEALQYAIGGEARLKGNVEFMFRRLAELGY